VWHAPSGRVQVNRVSSVGLTDHQGGQHCWLRISNDHNDIIEKNSYFFRYKPERLCYTSEEQRTGEKNSE
jgi:hypothetical protein